MINSLEDVRLNMKLFHVYLMKQRLGVGNSANLFGYYCETYHYPRLAQQKYAYLPHQDFHKTFLVELSDKAKLIDSHMTTLLDSLSPDQNLQDVVDNNQVVYSEEEKKEMSLKTIRRVVFLNQVRVEDEMVEKFYRYQLAHQNYLGSLSTLEIMEYRVNWGIQRETQLIHA